MATSGVMRMRGDDDSDTEYKPIYDDNEGLHQRTAQETKGWNLFRDIPVKKETGSMVSTDWVDTSIKVIKLLAYILVFAAVLGSAVIVKGTLLFITSQLKKERQINHCNKLLALDQQFVTVLPLEERVTWLWAVFIVFSVPELGVFLRSMRICFFKSIKKPTKLQFLVAFVDTLQTVALASLLLIILPELDVLKGAMLMNALCIVPGLLNAFGRDNTDPNYYLKIAIDILAVSIQASAFVVWPLLNGNSVLWCIPFACIFISLGWWENYVYNVDKNSSMLKVYLYKLRIDLKRTRYFTQSLLSIWKIIVFMICIIVYSAVNEDDPFSFFTSFNEAFNERTYKAYEVQAIIEDAYDGLIGYEISGSVFELPAEWSSALWVALINVGSAFFCYTAAKFACKILIQGFSFTFALTLVGPVAINILIVFCGIRNADPCAFHDTIPDYLFFDIPPVYFLRHFIRNDVAWIWLLWLLSQTWVTLHTWYASCERLAATEKLFNQPWYCGPLIDQSLLLNRTRDETEFNIEDLIERRESERSSISSEENINIKASDKVPRIFICATMWHETKEEMLGFLKSIYRLDEDQSARRVAQKYLGVVDPDYYELEANIFLDDGFKSVSAQTEDSQVNSFVKCLIECIDEAASEVHLVNVRLRPPKKYPTPYGGRLEWTLPGKNKLICHMKDKTKVRHKKRWSQVMYMYYFLGHRLMDCPISVDRKEVIAENTFLLALDGDIDFKPAAVALLIDLMKKNKKVGAACGRIHPVGSGFMAWYQSFEYAVGHWLQKATEHMLGCVLCSPGCFSLFRGKALMDDNVMRRYTLTSSEARHFVQYDQGEDRWLCTLLLQRGYRVEYSAASDAYTHCPEHFDEFYNQRRRWVPSTMANIMDLLADSKHTVSVNDSISTLYIIYQGVLMAGSILGPGTIFLMMVGAMNAITGMSNMTALFFNLIPLIVFLFICMTCESKVQLTVATIITCAYAMLMMMVGVGIAMQIIEDGWLAPSSIFTVSTFGIFIITALLHPQEINCLLCIVIYYITIPSMYMLLIIYSLCNLNNISWGTREVPQQKSEKEFEMEKKEVEAAKKKMDNTSLMKWFGNTEETSGTLECGVAGVFRCMCCTNPKDHKEDLHLLQIANTLDKIEKKIDTLGASEEVVETAPMNISRRRSSVAPLAPLQEYPESEASGDTPREERDDQVNPYWIEDPDLLKGEVDFLTTVEITFWKDMIDTYLEPILENKEERDRVTRELKNLRDMMVFAFMMLNALFVLVVFLLQLNQDQMHLNWPLGKDIAITYDDNSNTVMIKLEYLMLEPVRILFLVVFGFVIVIQFIAMFLYRIGTLTHLLSTTQLNWFFTKQPEDLSEQAMLDKHAVQLAKELQRLNVDDLEQRGVDEENVTRRKTILNLERGRDAKQNNINLDDNFKRRLTILQDADVDTISRMPSLGGTANARRATLRAIMTRRDSVIAEKRRSQSQLQADTDLYDSPADSTARFGGPYPSSNYELRARRRR